MTVTGIDALGNTTRTSQKITIGTAIVDPPALPGPQPPAPGPAPAPAVPAPAPKAPVLSGLQQSNSRWLTHKATRGPRLPVGTTFRFKLDRAAQVRFSFSQLVTGRRVGGRCVKVTKANKSKSRCDRAQGAGTLNVTGKAGANTVAFSGKISGRALKPGRYRVLVTALADGKTSPADRSSSRSPADPVLGDTRCDDRAGAQARATFLPGFRRPLGSSAALIASWARMAPGSHWRSS